MGPIGMGKKLASNKSIASSMPTKKRGRPKTRQTGNVVTKLRLRDTLRQLEADSPAVDLTDPAFNVQCRTGAEMLRLYTQGQAVFISRGILRAMIAELG